VNDAIQALQRFEGARVLLIGDTIVDEYVYGTVLGTSAETPTIVARELETKTYQGGAFLVARHLLALGAKVTFCTLVGHDKAADVVTGFTHPSFTLLPVTDADRKTTIKKRFWVDGYKLLQFDQLDNRPFLDVAGISASLAEAIRANDVVVVSDYRHGLLSPAVIAAVLGLARDAGKLLYVDSQVSQSAANHTLYRGADVICLNLKEARAIDAAFDPAAVDAGRPTFATLVEKLGIPNIVVKLGAQGAIGWLGGRAWQAKALSVQVVDTCGAGDAFLAAFCLAGLAAPQVSLRIANHWAGLATTIHGTVPPTTEQLVATLEEGAR